MYEDKTLVCKECGNEFVFTAGEQVGKSDKSVDNAVQRIRRKVAEHLGVFSES